MTPKPDLTELREMLTAAGTIDNPDSDFPLPWQALPGDTIIDGRDCEIYHTSVENFIVAAINALPWLLEQAERAEQPKVCADCGKELTDCYVFEAGYGSRCDDCAGYW